MPRWFRLVYGTFWLPVLPFALVRLVWKARRNPDYHDHWRERLALSCPEGPFDVWLHTVSVGEARAAQPVLAALLARGLRVLVTCTTPTGRATLEHMVDRHAPKPPTVRYLPYDAPWLLGRFFSCARPTLGLLVETELWPGACDMATRHGSRVWLINARLSERSAAGYARGGSLTTRLLGLLAGIAAQTQAHAARFRALGACSVVVTGNLKFDVEPPADVAERSAALIEPLLRGRAYWVAGSTREGEEALLLDALAKHPLRQRAVAVIVPRHPERWSEVAALARSRGFRVALRSDRVADADAEVILGDSMGEMFAWYAGATAVVMGGTLGGTGGQNLIEPAALGVPVALGPSVFNFQQAAEEALAAGAAVAVADATGALDAVLRWFEEPMARERAAAAAATFVTAHRGATARTLKTIGL